MTEVEAQASAAQIAAGDMLATTVGWGSWGVEIGRQANRRASFIACDYHNSVTLFHVADYDTDVVFLSKPWAGCCRFQK